MIEKHDPVKLWSWWRVHGTLSSLLTTYSNIPLYVKLSILQDVSRGVHYLHSHNPPIIHSHINTDIILLTSTLTAKIGSFTFAQEVVPKVEKISGSHLNHQAPVYQSFLSASHGFPFDVYLFGFVICRVMTQLQVRHSTHNLYQYKQDANTSRLFVACDFTYASSAIC